MATEETNSEIAATVGLSALSWIVGDEARATRFLDLTGINLATLRAQAGEPAFLAATLAFLENHEPDLLACAEALSLTPEQIVAARRTLEA